MTYLLDVNVVLALVWQQHSQHAAATAWLGDKSVAICPLVELGFLRISTQPRAFNVVMADARAALAGLLRDLKPQRLPDDLPALESQPKTSAQVTEHYLADLARKHGCQLATFDSSLKHRAVVLVR